MYDIIVVGAGHAGIEAALACARLKMHTALITYKEESIGKMPCNPSVGGPAKGIVVREIDALGGQMPLTADATALQFKMLNTTKGPGVQSLRVQSDKVAYSKMMIEVIKSQENLDLIIDEVREVKIENQISKGVILKDGSFLSSKIVILTTGTYMSSLVMISSDVTPSGPDGDPTTNELSESLKRAGLKTFRLKTGTPPRVLTSSIDFSKVQLEPGTKDFYSFSTETEQILPYDQQVPCYLTYTSAKTHEIIKENLHKSSMYS